jgi:hypothetical protein
MSGRRRKGELFGGVLLIKSHEVVAEGGGNGGWERRWKWRAKPWVRTSRGCRCLNMLDVARAPLFGPRD